MINLIGNELKKIFKKKTIYILLIIIVGYILISNIIIKATDDGYSYHYYYEGDIEYIENYLSELDPNNPSEYPDFASFKRQLETLNLTKKYGNDSWQAYVINTKLPGYIDTMIEYEYSNGVTEKAYNEAKKDYEIALEKLDADDWKYFVSKELNETNKAIDEQNALKENVQNSGALAEINKTIEDLQVQKQVDTWRLEKNISYAPSFLNDAIEKYYNSQTSLNDYDSTKVNELSSDELQSYNSLLEEANLNKYYIDNMVTLDNSNRNTLINLFSNYELFILIVGIVIAGSIVSDEFNKGTIKLLLVKPYSRVKILLSKFIVCMIILVLSIAFITICQTLIGGIIFGFDGLSIPAIVYNFDTNSVETINLFGYVALIGICKLPIYILLTTLAFACSTIFTNTALAVAVPFLGYIGASIINQLALLYDFKQIIYFVTPNWDLTYYLFGGSPLFKGLTAPFSLIICTIYLLIMLVVSLIVFKKRDIKNI